LETPRGSRIDLKYGKRSRRIGAGARSEVGSAIVHGPSKPVGLEVKVIDRPGCEEKALAAVPVWLGSDLAFGQFCERRAMIREAQIMPYALKRPNAVVPDFAPDQVRSRFPSHGRRSPAGMIDGIVEQFGKRVPRDVESLP